MSIAHVEKALKGTYVIVKSWFLEHVLFKPNWVHPNILQDVSLYQYIHQGKVYQLLKETVKLYAAPSSWARLFPGLEKLLMQVTSYMVIDAFTSQLKCSTLVSLVLRITQALFFLIFFNVLFIFKTERDRA